MYIYKNINYDFKKVIYLHIYMIPEEVIITAIMTGIVSVLGLTFKSIKRSQCWSQKNCCLCIGVADTSTTRESISSLPAPITSSTV
jgi:hypothetical protein